MSECVGHPSERPAAEGPPKNDADVSLPSYVRWDSDQFSAAEIYPLLREGATTLPSRRCMNALLESYIDMVHPQMPFLDLPEFLTPIASGGQEPQISLLLLQAVLFAGSLYLADTRIFQPEATMKQVQSTLFRKVKVGPMLTSDGKAQTLILSQVLYDAKYEKDPLVVAQAGLLMSLLRGTDMKTCKEGAFLLNTSVLAAQQLVVSTSGNNLLMNHSFRCLWWSLFTRTSLLALHLSERPATMLPADHVDMPELPAFQTLHFQEGVAETFENSILMQRPSLLSTLAEIFICRLRLAALIYRILDAAQHIPEDGIACRGRNMVSRKDRLEEQYTAELGVWDVELEKWWYSLPKCNQPSLYRSDAKALEDLHYFHRAIPVGEYFRISNAIAEFLTSRQTESYSFKTLTTKLQQEMICARMLDVMEGLHETNLARYVGNYGFAIIETALERCFRSANLTSNCRDLSRPLRFMKTFLDARRKTIGATPFLSRVINQSVKNQSEEMGEETRMNSQQDSFHATEEEPLKVESGEGSCLPSLSNASPISLCPSGLPFGYDSVYGLGDDESPNSLLFASKTCSPEEDLLQYGPEPKQPAPQALSQKGDVKELSILDYFPYGSASGWMLPDLKENGGFLNEIEEGAWPP